MTVPEWISCNLPLKLLSLTLAVFIWFFVVGGKEVEREFRVPVAARNLPAGLAPVSPLPQVDLRVAGPRYVMAGIEMERLSVVLDFTRTGEGRVVFSALERGVSLPLGSRVTRIFPASVEVRLAKMQMNRRSE